MGRIASSGADLVRFRNNRVAVVVFAGNTNKSFSEGGGNTQVILPLDSYTTNQAGTARMTIVVLMGDGEPALGGYQACGRDLQRCGLHR